MTSKERNPKFRWQSDFIESGVTGNAGFIGLLMSTYDNGDGTGLWVTQQAISEKTRLDVKTVSRNIRKLMDAGWIERTSQGRAGRASRYRLATPNGTAASGSTDDASRTSDAGNRTAVPGSTGQQCPPIRPILRPSQLDQYETEHSVMVDNRPEWKQRQEIEREYESQGLDRNGEPLPTTERRSIYGS